MRIVNRSGRTIAYELRAGPLRMTMSECDLAPGEEEEWESPYRTPGQALRCVVRVSVDDELVGEIEVGERAVVQIEQDGEQWRIVAA